MTHPDKLADDPFIVFGLIALLGAVTLWRWARSESKALRLMDGLPLARARSAAMGRCMVFGQVEPLGDLVVAPISGESVVWYRWEDANDDEWDWEEPEGNARASSQQPFRLVDGTESIVIVPRGARTFRTPSINHWYQPAYPPKTEAGRAAAGSHPAREWTIRAGDIMVAVGQLQPGQGGAGGDLPRLVDASPETPLIFAVGWDRVQAWNDKKKVRWARAGAVALFGAALYMIF